MNISFIKSVQSAAKKLLGVVALATFLGGGMLTAAAGGSAAFNNLPDDYLTLQVAKTGTAWGPSANANVGEVLNLLVWDHNTAPDVTATNVRVKVTLPSGVATHFVPTASVSADNANAANGSVNISLSAPGQLSYVPGSAKFLRNVNGVMTAVNWPAGVNPDEVVAGGVNLGDQAGCWQFAQAISIQVRVEGGTSAISTNKAVQLAGGPAFSTTASASPGDLVWFKIYMENTGNATGTHPKITDTLDPLFSYVPGSSYMLVKQNNADFRIDIPDNLIRFQGQTITWAFSDIGPTPDKAFYLIFQAKVAAANNFGVGQTTLQNCALSSFDNVSAQTNCVTVVVSKSPNPVVSFTLRKEVTNLTLGDSKWYDQQLASAAPGDTVAYRLIVVNTGNTPATNVILKDILPANVSFVGNVKLYDKDHQNGLDISGSDVVGNGFVIPTLNNGNDFTTTLIFSAKITSNCSGQQTLTNLGQVIWQNQVRVQDDASLVISCTRGLIISKDIQDPADNQFKNSIPFVKEGQILTYRINVQNNGNVVVTNPTLRDVLPANVSYVNNSLAVDGEFQSAVPQQAFFNGGIILTNLNPGMGKVITFQVKVNECPTLGDTPLINRAYVRAENVAELSAQASTVIRVTKPTLTF